MIISLIILSRKIKQKGLEFMIGHFWEHDSLNVQTGKIFYTQKPFKQLVLLDHLNNTSAVQSMVLIMEPKWTVHTGQDCIPTFEVTKDIF